MFWKPIKKGSNNHSICAAPFGMTVASSSFSYSPKFHSNSVWEPCTFQFCWFLLSPWANKLFTTQSQCVILLSLLCVLLFCSDLLTALPYSSAVFSAMWSRALPITDPYRAEPGTLKHQKVREMVKDSGWVDCGRIKGLEGWQLLWPHIFTLFPSPLQASAS